MGTGGRGDGGTWGLGDWETWRLGAESSWWELGIMVIVRIGNTNHLYRFELIYGNRTSSVYCQ